MHRRLLAVALAAACFACGTAAPPSTSTRESVLAGALEQAVYDGGYRVPVCPPHPIGSPDPSPGCTTGTLVAGRGTMALHPEAGAPNTLLGSCQDTEGGVYQQDSSVEAIRVFSEDGLPLAAGKAAIVEIDAWIGASLPNVHLYTTSSAGGAWTTRGRVVPGPAVQGAFTATFRYVLPAAGFEAVRAVVVPYPPSSLACFYGSFPDTEADDLAFDVVAGSPDVAPPTVAMVSPADGAQVNGTVTLQATASDDQAVASVQFLLDGSPIRTVVTTPWTASWDTSTAALGLHTVAARAQDTAGNVTDSAPITVEVLDTPDTTAPAIGIDTPAMSAVVGGTVQVQGAAQDDEGVVRIELYLQSTLDISSGVLVGALDLATPQERVSYTIPWNTTAFPDARYEWLMAYAYDAAGNRGRYGQRWITVDNSPPAVAITAPADGGLVKGSSTTITATAADLNGVAKVEFLVDGALIGTSGVAPYSASWDTKKLAAGAHVLVARATDLAGLATTSAPITVTKR